MKIRTKLAVALLGLASLVQGGCGSSAPASTTDPDRARTVLRDVLDAWKRGDAFDAPSKLSPPIYVADEDWQAGTKLTDYRIEPGDHAFGTSLRCPVSLTLSGASGKPRKRTAFYIITTDPVLRVDRQDAP